MSWGRFTRAFLIASLVAALATACAPSINDPTRASAGISAPDGVTLSFDKPAVYSELSAGVGTIPAVAGSNPALGGTNAMAGGSTPALGGATPSSIGDAPVVEGASPAAAGNVISDATATYTVNASVSAHFPSSSHAPVCEWVGPFATTASCSGFSFSTALLTSSGTAKIKSYDQATPALSSSSSELPARRYLVSQVANTVNDQNALDNPSGFFQFNGALYFVGNSRSFGSKLFKVTVAGAVTQISNLRNNQAQNDQPVSPIAFNGAIYFEAYSRNGKYKLFKLSTADAITQIGNTSNDQTLDDSAGSTKLIFNGELYFTANNPSSVQKIFKVSTGDVITQVSNIRNDQTLSDGPSLLGVFNSELYFSAYNSNGVFKLFKMTTAGVITQVADTRNDQTVIDFPNMPIVRTGTGAGFYFVSYNSNGMTKLYKVDTAGVVTQVSDTRNDATLSDQPLSPYLFNNEIYFMARNSAGFFKIFKVTASDKVLQVTNTRANQSAGDVSTPHFTEVGGYLYFYANNSNGASKIYRIDSQGSVTQLSNFRGDQTVDDSASNSNLYLLVSFDNALFLSAYNTAGKIKLIGINSSGQAFQAANTHGNNALDDLASIAPLAVFNGELYFSSSVSSGANKLHKLAIVP